MVADKNTVIECIINSIDRTVEKCTYQDQHNGDMTREQAVNYNYAYCKAELVFIAEELKKIIEGEYK